VALFSYLSSRCLSASDFRSKNSPEGPPHQRVRGFWRGGPHHLFFFFFFFFFFSQALPFSSSWLILNHCSGKGGPLRNVPPLTPSTPFVSAFHYGPRPRDRKKILILSISPLCWCLSIYDPQITCLRPSSLRCARPRVSPLVASFFFFL